MIFLFCKISLDRFQSVLNIEVKSLHKNRCHFRTVQFCNIRDNQNRIEVFLGISGIKIPTQCGFRRTQPRRLGWRTDPCHRRRPRSRPSNPQKWRRQSRKSRTSSSATRVRQVETGRRGAAVVLYLWRRTNRDGQVGGVETTRNITLVMESFIHDWLIILGIFLN